MIKIIHPQYPFTKSSGFTAFANLIAGVAIFTGIIAIISMGLAWLVNNQDEFNHTQEKEKAR